MKIKTHEGVCKISPTQQLLIESSLDSGKPLIRVEIDMTRAIAVRMLHAQLNAHPVQARAFVTIAAFFGARSCIARI